MTEPRSCPRCGATDETRFREKRGDWFCDACDCSWAGDPPTPAAVSGSDRATTLRPTFVSYGHADAPEFARRLRDDLTAAGCRVWLDIDAIAEGAHWDVRIEAGIRDSEVLLAVMTPHSTREGSICRDEVILAHTAGKAIVPLRVSDDAAVRPALLLVRRSWLDFTGDYEAALATLLCFLSGDASALQQPAFTLVNGHVPFDPGPEIARHAAGFVGRDWLFAELTAWLADPRGRAFVIVGGPGTGKSAIAARLSQRSADAAAVHFCWAGNARSLDPAEFVASVVGALSERVPGYAEALAERSPESPREDASVAFRELVVEPARKTPEPERPQLLIVDALDEAVTRDGLTIADVVLTHAESLPSWLRIVATTRPESHVVDRLRCLDTLELDAERADNLADVAAFVSRRLAEPLFMERLGDASPEVAVRLEELAAGNFLYATMALDALERGSLTRADLAALSPGLSDYYTKAFLRAFPGADRYALEEAPILRCLAAAFAPVPLDVLRSATGSDAETFNRRLRRLRPFMREGDESGSPTASLFHRSMADWLLDSQQAGDYFCDVAAGHDMLAEALAADSLASEYSLRWLPRHLTVLGRWDALYATLTDFAFLEHKVRRVAVAAATDAAGNDSSVYNGVHALIEDYDRALAAMSDGRADAGSEGAGGSTDRRFVVEAFRRVLRLEAHNLTGRSVIEHRAFFWQQLYNRLQWDVDTGKPGADEVDAGNAGPAGLLPGLLEPELAFRSAVAAPLWLHTLTRASESEALIRTFAGHAGSVSACAFSPDGQTIVSGSDDGTLRLWDARTGAEAATLGGHTGRVYACAFSPDGQTIVSGSGDKTLRLWDARTGAEAATLGGHTGPVYACAFSPDGQTILSGSGDRTLRLWDARTGAEAATLGGHTGPVYACAFSPDGQTILSGSGDRTLRLWDAASGACCATLAGHTDLVFACAFSPDGQTIVSGSGDRTLRLWDAASGAERLTLKGHTGRVRACAFSPDGQTIVSASDDETLNLWDAASGAEILTLAGHTGRVMACAFSPDGQTIVSGSVDRTLRLWDPHSAAQRLNVEGHTGRVRACAFSPDGQTIVSGSGDKTLRLWDAGSGVEILTLSALGGLLSCAFSPLGDRVCCGDGGGNFYILELIGARV